MIHLRGMLGAMALAATAITFPQKSLADGLNGHDFLTWSVEGQNNYIQTAIVMATLVASRTNQETSKCLEEWYVASSDAIAAREVEIKATIARNADYHPSAVILLVMEGACGSFSS